MAVVLGDKEQIDESTSDTFRRAGLAHILVVSGFNVAIIALLVYYLLRFVGIVRLRWRVACSMVAVALYAMTIGLEPSVMRAFISVECVFLAILFERKPDIGNISAATASLALVLDPSLLFDAGFQLTYGAVFALVLISPALKRLFVPARLEADRSPSGRVLYYIASTLVSSSSVTLGLLPVMLWHFHRITIIGVLSNLAGIPLATLLTALSFLLVPLGIVSPWLAGIYGEVTSVLAGILSWLASISSAFSWSSITVTRPTVVVLAGYFSAMVYVLRSVSLRRCCAKAIVVASGCSLLLVAEVPLAAPIVAQKGILSILFCDVGQGDAMIVHTPGGKTYAVDFGGLNRDGKAVAKRTMLPLLEAEGMPPIDEGFITHMHIDHYGGTATMVQAGLLRAIGTSGERASGPSALQLDSLCLADHIPVVRLQRSRMITLDSDVRLYLLNPDSAIAVPGDQMNHHSLVMRLCYGETSVLLLGDIEASDEVALAKRYGSFLHSDIVKVAHHGSRYSSDSSFASVVKASYSVVSVGEHNSFGHPSIAALGVWRRAGAEIHRTDREGAQLFRSDGKRMWRTDWRSSE